MVNLGHSLGRRKMGKNTVIKVRCSPETKLRFKRFSVNFKCMEDALVFLLEYGEKLLSERPSV